MGPHTTLFSVQEQVLTQLAKFSVAKLACCLSLHDDQSDMFKATCQHAKAALSGHLRMPWSDAHTTAVEKAAEAWCATQRLQNQCWRAILDLLSYEPS